MLKSNKHKIHNRKCTIKQNVMRFRAYCAQNCCCVHNSMRERFMCAFPSPSPTCYEFPTEKGSCVLAPPKSSVNDCIVTLPEREYTDYTHGTPWTQNVERGRAWLKCECNIDFKPCWRLCTWIPRTKVDYKTLRSIEWNVYLNDWVAYAWKIWCTRDARRLRLLYNTCTKCMFYTCKLCN